MTRPEREDLLKVARMHAKVAKADAVARSARLRAQFEEQLAADYSYDDERSGKRAHAVALAAAEQAHDIVARRCQEVGIPRRFAPSLHSCWHGRGENAVKDRRAEHTLVAHSRIAQLEKEAKLAIDRASVETQAKLSAAGLQSAEAFVLGGNADCDPTDAACQPSRSPKANKRCRRNHERATGQSPTTVGDSVQNGAAWRRSPIYHPNRAARTAAKGEIDKWQTLSNVRASGEMSLTLHFVSRAKG
jgi:hypothetical protein